MIPCHKIAEYLETSPDDSDDRLVIAPMPDLAELRSKSEASIDLRLGSWFSTTKARRHPILDIYEDEGSPPKEASLSSTYYVPFREKFILHPRRFVLAVTLEWIRIPSFLGGMVTGKSSWGRRGLIIETAPGVHPGFSGCLTLEVANVGDIPIAIKPGTPICQLFLHKLDEPAQLKAKSKFQGQRRPKLGSITLDDYSLALTKKRLSQSDSDSGSR